jgi:hypothetical protein
MTPNEVLVLFNTRWPDEDGNYRSDYRSRFLGLVRGISR